MYTINYFNDEKLVGQKTFKTFHEAENNYSKSSGYSKCNCFEIVDNSNGEVVMEFVVPQKSDMLRDFFSNEDEDYEDYGYQLGI